LPLTADIFPVLLERLESKSATLFGGDAIDQGRLRQCLDAILPGLSAYLSDFSANSQARKARRAALPLTTDVRSTLDFLLPWGTAPHAGLTLPELARARRLLERVVFERLVRNKSPDALRMEGVPDIVRNEWRQPAELHQLAALRPVRQLGAVVTTDRCGM
jgi:hypothetical protein